MNDYRTRKPTGQVSWPIIVLAGVEGGGKTWAAAEATGAELIDRAFFLEVGERMGDEYGTVPGADYEIIEHDGTWGQVLGAAQWAARQTPADGRANMLIIDSITEVWALLSDVAQNMANDRARRKNRGGGGDAQITMDLWNAAKDALGDLLDACRAFPGPVILTARLDNVAVVEGGKPTGEHVWKIRAEKNLPYAATVIVQARAPRDWMITKIASTRVQLPAGGEQRVGPGFTVADLLARMGVTAETAAPSSYVRPSPDGTPHRSEAQAAATAADRAAFMSEIGELTDRDAVQALAPRAAELGLTDDLRARWSELANPPADPPADKYETVTPEVMNDDQPPAN